MCAVQFHCSVGIILFPISVSLPIVTQQKVSINLNTQCELIVAMKCYSHTSYVHTDVKIVSCVFHEKEVV